MGTRLAGEMMAILQEWKKERLERATEEIEYMDSLVPYYHAVTGSLPTQRRKIMTGVLDAGYDGISPTILAANTALSVNIITSEVGRLVAVGLVERKKTGRRAMYRCTDMDLVRLRVFCSPEFADYRNEHRGDDTPLRDFMGKKGLRSGARILHTD